MDAKHLGKRIAAAREAAGLTQEALAELVGVDAMTVSKWERGVQEPRWARLGVVAEKLGVSVEALTSDTPLGVSGGTMPKPAETVGEAARLVGIVLGRDLDEQVRAWQLAEIASVFRNYTLAKDADGAEERARAASSSERGTLLRLLASMGGEGQDDLRTMLEAYLRNVPPPGQQGRERRAG